MYWLRYDLVMSIQSLLQSIHDDNCDTEQESKRQPPIQSTRPLTVNQPSITQLSTKDDERNAQLKSALFAKSSKPKSSTNNVKVKRTNVPNDERTLSDIEREIELEMAKLSVDANDDATRVLEQKRARKAARRAAKEAALQQQIQAEQQAEAQARAERKALRKAEKLRVAQEAFVVVSDDAPVIDANQKTRKRDKDKSHRSYDLS